MTEKGYTPYCGNENCRTMPRTIFKEDQFHCPSCQWKSKFPNDFIKEYKAKWKITKLDKA